MLTQYFCNSINIIIIIKTVTLHVKYKYIFINETFIILSFQKILWRLYL